MYKNILISINEFGIGGAERIVSYILERIPNLNTNIRYFLHLLEAEQVTYPIPADVTLYSGSKITFYNSVKFIRLPFQAIKLANIIKKNKINTVLSLLNRANYVNILSHILTRKYLCIISERNTPSQVYWTSSLSDRINRYLIKKLYPHCDKIIAISEGVKSDLILNFNISKDMIIVIYNPIDIDDVKNKAQEKNQHMWFEDNSIKTIISVGRLEKQKNHALLIKAFNKVILRFPNTRLMILGEGSERNNLENLIKELDLMSKVELSGLQNNPFSFLSRAYMFAFSSNFEGFGNVIIEAMVCGCPVISTDCQSGPGEIIAHNKSGLLVPVGDQEAMSQAIISLLENQKLRKTLITEAYSRAQDFRLDKIIEQYYKTILASND